MKARARGKRLATLSIKLKRNPWTSKRKAGGCFKGILIGKSISWSVTAQTAIAIPVSGIFFARCGASLATRLIPDAYERGLISADEI
jgi:hypothetical protein